MFDMTRNEDEAPVPRGDHLVGAQESASVAPLVQTRSGLTGRSRLFRDKRFRGSTKSNDCMPGEKVFIFCVDCALIVRLRRERKSGLGRFVSLRNELMVLSGCKLQPWVQRPCRDDVCMQLQPQETNEVVSQTSLLQR